MIKNKRLLNKKNCVIFLQLHKMSSGYKNEDYKDEKSIILRVHTGWLPPITKIQIRSVPFKYRNKWD